MAGIDGVRKRIDPKAAGFGPVDVNIFAWSEEERRKIKSLPTSLSEACDALERDHGFLLEGDVFDGDQLLDYVAHLRANDADVRNRPHPYEVGKYFDA
jgi:glutamine synthetase